MERQPRSPEGGEQPHRNGQAERAAAEEQIEQLRSEAAEQRQREQALYERYVAAGLNPDDPVAAINFGRYVRELHAELASREPDSPASAERPANPEIERQYQPQVYVADLSSYRRGIRHGLWIDANQAPRELDADVAIMLETSPTVGATEWTVHTAEDFAGLDLTGYNDTTLISRLARGVAEHGVAYAAFVEINDTDNSELLERFDDFYVGSFESPEAWARAVGDDLEWNGHLDQVVDPQLRPYLLIDYARFARDQRQSWDILAGHDGQTHVFLR